MPKNNIDMVPPIPGYNNYNQPNVLEGRQSDTISWLGFGLSLFVLVLLWITLFIVVILIKNSYTYNSNGATSFLMLFFLVGIPLGIAGLVLSILGLIKASNNGGKKWIGACGIGFSALSVLSVFVPVLITTIFR
ncbi:MAG: hypothetical protein NC111_04365 [Bacteroides sp.]|nr:hypothetical protein [Bacteroides sp.]MCM1413038.1 hypothetical protein [Bacteroides sp.]MCM1471744.1 hypothetical protein [Bacteroides sp.]